MNLRKSIIILLSQIQINKKFQKRCLLLLCIITSQISAKEEAPNFVLNTIMRAPCLIQKITDIDRELVGQLPYYIEKDNHTKNPSRGRLTKSPLIPNQMPYKASSILGSFFDTVSKESFGRTNLLSEKIAPKRIKVAVLLNRIKSIDENINCEFYSIQDDLPTTLEHHIITALWEPQWIKRVVMDTGQTCFIPVNLAEVSQYYHALKQNEPILANAFLHINENESLNSIVPYRELRELLLKDEATKSLVRSSRSFNPKAPVYLAFIDSDLIAMRTSTQGLFSYYENAIMTTKESLHGLTTGYTVSMKQDPFASLSVALDLATRQALATIFSLAPYYPEPNALISIIDAFETLEVSFPGIAQNAHSKYTSPQELPLLLHELVKKRFQGSNEKASPHFAFLTVGAIETEKPLRFLQNRKKKDGAKNIKIFSNGFSSTINQFTSITLQDLKQSRNTAQSHLKSRDWSTYVHKFLEEKERAESIKIIDLIQPGSIVKNRKDQFLISMFSSIHSAYSPIAITIKEVEVHGYNPMEYLLSLIARYDTVVPTPLNITYGDTGKSTKLTGNLLKKHVSTYQQLSTVIDKFYHQPVSNRVIKASHLSGSSEIPVIIRYIQQTHVLAIPKAIIIKTEPPAEITPISVIQQIHTPFVPVIYPKAELTVPNIKKFLTALSQKVYCTTIDHFTGIKDGNTSRIMKESKLVSTNTRAVWSEFNTQDWDTILNGLSMTLLDFSTIMGTHVDTLTSAKNNQINVLDTFFFLKQ